MLSDSSVLFAVEDLLPADLHHRRGGVRLHRALRIPRRARQGLRRRGRGE